MNLSFLGYFLSFGPYEKTEIIESIQQELGCESKAEAQRAYDAVIKTLQTGIKAGAKAVAKPKKGEAAVKPKTVLQITGLGSFKVGGRPARDGRNPTNGDKVRIKAKKTLSFKPATDFKF